MENFTIVARYRSPVRMCEVSTGIVLEFAMKDEEGRPADTRTQAQRFALLDLLTILKHQYPDAQILGHYQLSASIHKACPCFDSRKEYMNI